MTDENRRLSFFSDGEPATYGEPIGTYRMHRVESGQAYYPPPDGQARPVRVIVLQARSRWQAFKDHHQDAWWMRRFVKRWPVRKKAARQYTGTIAVTTDDTPERRDLTE